MKSLNLLKISAAAFLLGAVATACSDDEKGGGSQTTDPASVQFLVTATDSALDLNGGASVLLLSDLNNTSRTNVGVYDSTVNTATSVYSPDGLAQVVYNHATRMFGGNIYRKGASAKGIGSGSNGIRTYAFTGSGLSAVAAQKTDGYSNFGAYGNYIYAVNISTPVVERVSAAGAYDKVTVDFSDHLINGSAPTISGIVDFGSGVVLSLNYADRDSAVIAFADQQLNISKVISSAKAGHGVAQRKAAKFCQAVTDADGNLYVFGGTATNDSRFTALRVNKGTTEFDASYVFDLNAATGGYRIRKVYPLTDDKFVLELFAEKGAAAVSGLGNTGNYAIVDMSDKTFRLVSGLPDISTCYIGRGDSYQGKFYLPVSGATGLLSGRGTVTTNAAPIVPTVYVIDGTTGKASQFMTFKSGNIIKGMTILAR